MNLAKTFIITSREYTAAVRSKSFLITLIVMPLLMGGGIIAQKVGQKIGDTSTYTVAIMDRSTGETLYPEIERAVALHNQTEILDGSGRQVNGRFVLEHATVPNPNDSSAADQQRLKLSDRVRSGELLAFVEIGTRVLEAAPAHPVKSDAPDPGVIWYSTNRPTYEDFLTLLRVNLSPELIQKKLSAAGEDSAKLRPLLSPPPIVEGGLLDLKDGKIVYQTHTDRVVSVLVPVLMIVMLFLVTLMGTSPIASNVVEEKQLRIAEVLLGSVTPFELMVGKLLGGVGVSLTLAAMFFSGAFYAAHHFGVSGFVSASSIGWFLFFTTVGTCMYGAIFAAAGAACSTMKEVQSFIMPVMLLIALPMFLLGPMLQNPSGPLGLVLSFFPISAPTVMVMRLTIPPGVPVWEPILAAVITLVATAGVVWAAARIFRVGILMQGNGANYAAVLRWIING